VVYFAIYFTKKNKMIETKHSSIIQHHQRFVRADFRISKLCLLSDYHYQISATVNRLSVTVK